MIFLCALLWGTAFVAQKASANCLGPFAVTFSRSVLAAGFLFVWAKLKPTTGFTRQVFIGGGLSGLMLFLAIVSQQIGIGHTTAGISSFLTTNYLIMVPILGLLVGRKTGLVTWLGVAIAIIGSFFICIEPGAGILSIGKGEAFTLLCAFLFAVQILVVDRFAPGTDILAFSCIPHVVVMLCSLPFLFLPSEMAHFTSEALRVAVWPILYIGIVSSGVAYTLQNIGQLYTPPTLAAILMSLESVFGALSGYVWFGDVFSPRQLLGCALLFLAASVASVFGTRKG